MSVANRENPRGLAAADRRVLTGADPSGIRTSGGAGGFDFAGSGAGMDWYLWLKALHIIAVIAWMAGMLYLPRLFVYHAEAARFSPASETFKVMERRLLKAIVNPSMIVVFITGFLLAYVTGYWRDPWLQMKFALVLGLSALHGYFARQVKAFAADSNRRSPRFFRILNEAPTVLLVLIVFLVVLKPF